MRVVVNWRNASASINSLLCKIVCCSGQPANIVFQVDDTFHVEVFYPCIYAIFVFSNVIPANHIVPA